MWTATFDRYAGQLPIVQVGGRQASLRTSWGGINEDAAMEMVIRHLAEQGIASVAYLAGDELSFESAELFATFHTHLRTYGLVTDPEWNRFGERSVQRAARAAGSRGVRG